MGAGNDFPHKTFQADTVGLLDENDVILGESDTTNVRGCHGAWGGHDGEFFTICKTPFNTFQIARFINGWKFENSISGAFDSEAGTNAIICAVRVPNRWSIESFHTENVPTIELLSCAKLFGV